MRISGFTSFEGIGIEDCDNFFQVSRTDANLRVERKLQWRTHLARDRKAQVSGAFLVDGEDRFKRFDTTVYGATCFPLSDCCAAHCLIAPNGIQIIKQLDVHFFRAIRVLGPRNCSVSIGVTDSA